MPTVLQQDGFSLVIYTHDHHPPHVHVWNQGTVAVIEIDPVRIRKNRAMPKSEVQRAVQIVEDHQDFLLAEWRRIHS